MSSITEELLGFTDLVVQLRKAQDRFNATGQKEDLLKLRKLTVMVDNVIDDILIEHRGRQEVLLLED